MRVHRNAKCREFVASMKCAPNLTSQTGFAASRISTSANGSETDGTKYCDKYVLSTPRDEWSRTSVRAAMRRADQLYSVSPDTKIEEALQLMDEKNVAQVPVMLDGRLLGMIGRDHLIHLILNRIALGNS